MSNRQPRRQSRNGSVIVEAAFVLPVFLAFLYILIAIGHVYMVDRLLKSACRKAARYGSAEGITSSQVDARVREVVSSAIDPDMVDVIVKDASVYDSGDPLPEEAGDYEALGDIEVSEAAPRQMFLVRATLDYGDVSIVNLPGLVYSAVLVGQAITRHE